MAGDRWHVDLVTNEELPFQFNPEEFELSLGADWHADTPHGASHARRSYRGSKGRATPLTLVFLRETVDGSDITALSRRLEALPFPDYDPDGRLRRGAHPVRLHFGCASAALRVVAHAPLHGGRGEARLRAVVRPETLQPGGIKAVIALDESPSAGDLSADDVRRGA